MSTTPPRQSSSLPILMAILGMSLLAVIGVIVITLLAPASENAVLITQIVTITAPTTAALLAFAKSSQNEASVREVHIAINSRMDQLLAATSIASHAQGVADGAATVVKEENTNAN